VKENVAHALVLPKCAYPLNPIRHSDCYYGSRMNSIPQSTSDKNKNPISNGCPRNVTVSSLFPSVTGTLDIMK